MDVDLVTPSRRDGAPTQARTGQDWSVLTRSRALAARLRAGDGDGAGQGYPASPGLAHLKGGGIAQVRA